jgi:dTDP-4-dehydrorhamnose reductase
MKTGVDVMKVLVTGVKGQLGFDVEKRLNLCGIAYLGCDINDFDLTNREQTVSSIKAFSPDVVIHCAAYTAVDNSEDTRELCYDINVNGTKYVAEACKDIDAKMVYISTDYVFEGQGSIPWKEDDPKNPINYYGETKSLGEDQVTELLCKYFIVRISWVFGINGNNFVKTMLKLGKERKELTVVSDQIGSPTYTYDLAKLLIDMIQTEKYGVYHATNEGYCSWFEFAQEIMKIAKLECEVKAIASKDYLTRASRPLNSRLDKSKLDDNGFDRLPEWKVALSSYFETLKTV